MNQYGQPNYQRRNSFTKPSNVTYYSDIPSISMEEIGLTQNPNYLDPLQPYHDLILDATCHENIIYPSQSHTQNVEYDCTTHNSWI